jgi:hypothetical protein
MTHSTSNMNVPKSPGRLPSEFRAHPAGDAQGLLARIRQFRRRTEPIRRGSCGACLSLRRRWVSWSAFTASKLHGEGRLRDFIFRMGYGILLRRSRPIEASQGIWTGLRNLTAFHCREREPDASRFMSLRSNPPRNPSEASDFDRVQLLHLRTAWGTMGLLFSEIRPDSLQSGSPSSFRL